MKKRIISFILAFSFAFASFTGALAKETNYYGDFEFPDIDYADMQYEKYDISVFNDMLEKVKGLLNSRGKSVEIFGLLDECENEFAQVQTMYALASVNASRENTTSNNAVVNETYAVYMDMIKSFNSALMEVYSSDYKKEFIQWFGEAETEDFIKNYPTEKYYEMSNREQELINEYMNNQLGAIRIIDGEDSYNLNEILAVMDEGTALLALSDIELAKKGCIRSEAFNMVLKGIKLYEQYLKESNPVLGDIYTRMVSVRTEIAEECGYDNYADYAYNEIYARDYTAADISTFWEYVSQYIVPLHSELSERLSGMQYEPFKKSEEEILQIIGKYMRNMSSELEDTFNYMQKYHLMDISPSDKKEAAGTAYTVAFPKYRSAYLFESPVNDSVWQLTTTVHEFGHFNSMLHDPVYYDGQTSAENVQNLDIAEVHSQGLEMLFMKYYSSIFGQCSAYEKMSRICDMLESIIDGCFYDEWQTEIYKNPDMSLTEINRLFKELSEKYQYACSGSEEEAYDWIKVPHNFTQPMYYISYAVSAVTALELWEQSLADFDAAFDRYMKLSTMGSYVPFTDALKACGFSDVFSEETIKNIENAVSTAFCLNYSDVDSSAWYYTAVTETANYIEPQAEKFMPEDNASRAVAAEALGRLYDEEKGIGEESISSFMDVSSKYISWAAENNIVNGYDSDYFGAYDSVTREQAAAMIYRYAEYEGRNMSEQSSIDRFADASEVSAWADTAMQWAAANGIVNGRDNNLLAPKEKVTRAELAQMLANFMRNVLTN